jgi:UDP-N-acetylglucosamine 2-epimerase (non-hydrolysing)
VEPDAIVIAGDRLETLAAATGATLVTVPIVHLHGGEQTEGLFDDAIRHAITKLAHLHLVSNEEHALRVIALGEDPASVHVVGAPSLDALARTDLADPAELEAFLGIPLERPLVIVTLHPTTLDSDPSAVAEPLVAALDRVRATYVITLPNADPGNQRIRTALIRAASESSSRVAVEALGERRYWGLMRHADAMIGNSSSGLIEAPALSLPAVNVGDRQAGRHRGANVIDCEASVDAISEALRHALDPQTRAALRSQPGLHLDGRTGVRIKERIAAWHPSHPPRKPLIAVDGRK